MTWIRVASVSELPSGSGRAVCVAERRLALFHVDGRLFAIDDECPHRGAPLSEGEVQGAGVVCPWHPSLFDLATGAPVTPPASTAVRCYPVRVDGSDIWVDVA